ncbi:MAG TPA: hypothetical protein VEA19_01180 [Actinomycetota bacterium]|nr:hypothetical protein [Actinomycetota bacterium]
MSGNFEPVEGVTLEKYAEVAAALTGATTEEEVEERAAARGFPAGRYAAIAEVWNQRVFGIPEVGAKYSELYLSQLRAQGIQPPEITLEQFAELLRRQGSGAPSGDVLAEFGLTPQTYALVSQEWARKMMSDPNVAMRIGQLLTAGMEAQPSQPPPEEPGQTEIRML